MKKNLDTILKQWEKMQEHKTNKLASMKQANFFLWTLKKAIKEHDKHTVTRKGRHVFKGILYTSDVPYMDSDDYIRITIDTQDFSYPRMIVFISNSD